MAIADAVLHLYAAIEAGATPDVLRQLFTDDARTVERPNALVPNGRQSDLEGILSASTSGATLLAQQRYDVRSIVENDDMVITRLTWTGVIANEVGPFAAGQSLVAHIAQFIQVRGGLIANIETYDCYEPFA